MAVDSDEALLLLLAMGDEEAFGRWIAVAERPLRTSLRSFATRVDVEAVLQETLLRIWQVAPRVTPDGRPNPLLRLALRVARNLAIDEVRRARTMAAGDEDLEATLAFAAPQETDPLLRKTIENCREELPQKPALALGARLESAGAEPDATLAARLGMQLNTFLQNFTRARKLLAKCLQARGVELEGTP
jgi:RNA polymerase sigma-70 factor (ECF subfamily)